MNCTRELFIKYSDGGMINQPSWLDQNVLNTNNGFYPFSYLQSLYLQTIDSYNNNDPTVYFDSQRYNCYEGVLNFVTLVQPADYTGPGPYKLKEGNSNYYNMNNPNVAFSKNYNFQIALVVLLFAGLLIYNS